MRLWRMALCPVVLTYSAISFSYFGVAITSQVQKRSATALAVSHNVKSTPSTADTPAGVTADSQEPDSSASGKSRPNNPVLLAGLLLAFAFATPVQAATQSILSAIIIGFGLWKAWTMNRAVELKITGPHALEPLPPASAT